MVSAPVALIHARASTPSRLRDPFRQSDGRLDLSMAFRFDTLPAESGAVTA
jgi:hypothetical protein